MSKMHILKFIPFSTHNLRIATPQKLLIVCWWDQTLFLVLLVLWNGSIFWSESFCFLHRVAILRLCVENGINFEICILLISAHPLAIHLLASLREGTESKEIAQKEKKNMFVFSYPKREKKYTFSDEIFDRDAKARRVDWCFLEVIKHCKWSKYEMRYMEMKQFNEMLSVSKIWTEVTNSSS